MSGTLARTREHYASIASIRFAEEVSVDTTVIAFPGVLTARQRQGFRLPFLLRFLHSVLGCSSLF